MIVISSSLPKSGSTLIANYQEDLLRAVEPRNGQAELRRSFGGRFVEGLGLPTLARLLLIHARHGSIVVKTHAGANPLVRRLIGAGVARATYCYRDPRDVILSAIDHGARTRRGEDPSGAFREYETVENSIPRVVDLIERWRAWERVPGVQFIRYETLMEQKLAHLRAMADYLGWPLPEARLAELVERHDPRKKPGASYNFNKGTTYRYRSEMSAADLQRATAALRGILVQYGYEPA